MTTSTVTSSSPALSGSGNLRNFGQMGDKKLLALAEQMTAYAEVDPKGWKAVTKEVESRGFDMPAPDTAGGPPPAPEGLTFTPHKAAPAKATANILNGSPDVWMEQKFDGWRMIAIVDEGGTVELYARTGTRLTEHLPHVVEQLTGHVPAGTILDGEAGVACDSWSQVQGVLSGHPKEASRAGQVGFFVFDCLQADGEDLMNETLEVRHQRLAEILWGVPGPTGSAAGIWTTPRFEATEEAYQRIIAAGFEGAVIKKRDSIYKPGAKGAGWIKLKLAGTEDVVVMGFRAGEGDRGQQRLLGAIEFGQYLDGELVARGSVGGGFDDDTARWIWEHQDELIGRVIEISHFGKAEGFRHPQWMRLRDSGDKAPEECLWS